MLSPEKPLSIASLANITNKADWVMNHDTELLLCAYCVSHDQKWLLATFCDRYGELLSTAVIGIHPAKYVDIKFMEAQLYVTGFLTKELAYVHTRTHTHTHN